MVKRVAGWAGKIAFVDLSSTKVCFEPTSSYQHLIGGRGIGAWLAAELIPETAEPLDPENALVLMTGPLTGTLAPSASRLSAVFKNVLTKGFGSSNVGGHFAAELKYAGIDGIVIRGQSPRPVCIVAFDGEVRIASAEHLWGLGTVETTRLLQRQLGDANVRVASIGPAGENLCAVASLMIDGARAAAYGGVGAVMGSKRVKAVAVRGTQPLEVARAEHFERIAEACRKKILVAPSLAKVRRYGTLIAGGVDGTMPQAVRNLQDGYWPGDKALRLSPLVFRELYERRRAACFSCPIGCGRVYEVLAEGRRTLFQGLEANAVSDFGPLCGCDDAGAVLKAARAANDLGLDWDGASSAIAWAMECFERGLMDSRDTDGLELRWGNARVIPELIALMAARQGFGDILADGPVLAAEKVGKGKELGMNVKGAPLVEPWLNIDPVWSLGVAVATRGSGHLNGAVRLARLRTAPDSILDEMRSLGLNITLPNPSPYEVASAVAWFEDFKAVVDSLGLCYFTSWWSDPYALGPDEYAELYHAATGLPATGQEMLRCGSLVQNVEKAFNTLHAGFGRNDDKLPQRLFTSVISAGPYQGSKLNSSEWERLLDYYYERRGYDLVTGWQKLELLSDLGISELEHRLRSAGRLPTGEMNG